VLRDATQPCFGMPAALSVVLGWGESRRRTVARGGGDPLAAHQRALVGETHTAHTTILTVLLVAIATGLERTCEYNPRA
jgi:hypothetical protein